mmetsp:Transcript_93177/g.268175  ORF Transcript_93177/g.268175 Transcript_93177/m.268175 type:complete len:236 (+) Transcript_93177:1831-2538(+)
MGTMAEPPMLTGIIAEPPTRIGDAGRPPAPNGTIAEPPCACGAVAEPPWVGVTTDCADFMGEGCRRAATKGTTTALPACIEDTATPMYATGAIAGALDEMDELPNLADCIAIATMAWSIGWVSEFGELPDAISNAGGAPCWIGRNLVPSETVGTINPSTETVGRAIGDLGRPPNAVGNLADSSGQGPFSVDSHDVVGPIAEADDTLQEMAELWDVVGTIVEATEVVGPIAQPSSH